MLDEGCLCSFRPIVKILTFYVTCHIQWYHFYLSPGGPTVPPSFSFLEIYRRRTLGVFLEIYQKECVNVWMMCVCDLGGWWVVCVGVCAGVWVMWDVSGWLVCCVGEMSVRRGGRRGINSHGNICVCPSYRYSTKLYYNVLFEYSKLKLSMHK